MKGGENALELAGDIQISCLNQALYTGHLYSYVEHIPQYEKILAVCDRYRSAAFHSGILRSFTAGLYLGAYRRGDLKLRYRTFRSGIYFGTGSNGGLSVHDRGGKDGLAEHLRI